MGDDAPKGRERVRVKYAEFAKGYRLLSARERSQFDQCSAHAKCRRRQYADGDGVGAKGKEEEVVEGEKKCRGTTR